MDAVVAQSREIIDRGSKSFGMAARLFTPETRDSAVMLYAWCRYCDDVIDGQDLGMGGAALAPEEAAARLADLEARTRAAMRGMPDGAPFEALARVVERHSIPECFPLDLLEGFAMDVREHDYVHAEDLLTYCYHVAGVVGVMMAYVMGVTERRTLRRANDLGIGFQLTNIARDVIPDAEQGRLYLPADWLAEAGLGPSPEAMLAPAHREAVARVALRLVETADAYYDSARIGIARLPWRCAWAIATARDVYRAIGYKVQRAGPEAWDQRLSVSTPRKLVSVMKGVWIASQAHLLGPDEDASPRTGLWTPKALRD